MYLFRQYVQMLPFDTSIVVVECRHHHRSILFCDIVKLFFPFPFSLSLPLLIHVDIKRQRKERHYGMIAERKLSECPFAILPGYKR